MITDDLFEKETQSIAALTHIQQPLTSHENFHRETGDSDRESMSDKESDSLNGAGAASTAAVTTNSSPNITENKDEQFGREYGRNSFQFFIFQIDLIHDTIRMINLKKSIFFKFK